MVLQELEMAIHKLRERISSTFLRLLSEHVNIFKKRVQN